MGEFSFTDFTFQANGEKWNQVDAQFTETLFRTRYFYLQKIWFSNVYDLTLDESYLSQHLSDWCWTQIVLASLILRPSSQVIYGSLPKVLRPLKARKGPQGQSRKVRVQIRLIFDSNTSQWTLEFWVRNTRRTFGTASLIKKKGPNLILKLST